MHQIKKEHAIYQMSRKNKPVLTVPSGTTVAFEVFDAFQNQIISEKQEINALNWDTVNPATGPLFIEGAEVGDVLKVHIKRMEIDKQGVMATIPGAGLLGDLVTTPQVKILPIVDGFALFHNDIKIPINPMIGVIGVAPKTDSIPCGTPNCHGGNMDNKKIVAGTTLYFPVFTKGALLAMGDLHAAMGDGEIMVTGVEIGGKVTVAVEVLKGQSINHPILETDTHFYTIASHEHLLEAVKIATLEMQGFVQKKLGLSFNEAGMLLSAIGDAEIAQVVDPLLTARFGLSKEILKELF
ncbi:MAG: acetamidase/formamidase family protein [Lachnospiraceae bacterium]|nr:acetamidase/formamidase family protein [Lachnospiraceae bacterium]